MIVDDNVFNLIALETILENYKQTVDKALNGEDAVEKVRNRHEKGQKNYDLIVMDINMPIKDGIYACKEIIRMLHNQKDQPYIVALTAYSTEAFKQRCFEAGMREFLTKPINEDQMHQLLLTT